MLSLREPGLVENVAIGFGLRLVTIGSCRAGRGPGYQAKAIGKR